jgi:quinol monooxygenase YgiN
MSDPPRIVGNVAISHPETKTNRRPGMIGRLMKMTAQPGRGPELADLLLRVTETLRDLPGCKIYAIAQDAKDPDTVRVIEAWQDEESAQQALTSSSSANSNAPKPADVIALLAGPPERVDLDLRGGVGLT